MRTCHTVQTTGALGAVGRLWEARGKCGGSSGRGNNGRRTWTLKVSQCALGTWREGVNGGSSCGDGGLARDVPPRLARDTMPATRCTACNSSLTQHSNCVVWSHQPVLKPHHRLGKDRVAHHESVGHYEVAHWVRGRKKSKTGQPSRTHTQLYARSVSHCQESQCHGAVTVQSL